jgi:very-short-patch-repair endonuclease
MHAFDAEDPLNRLIAALAKRQGGVVSRGQLVDLGLRRGAIEDRIKRGWLHPLYRGVYALGHLHLGATGRWFAAVLACGDRAVLSHRSAAAARDLLRIPSGRIDVTVPPDGARSKPGIRTHRRALAPSECVELDGLPITSVERTLLDIANLTKFETFQRCLENAQRRQIVDHATLTSLSDAGLPGSPVLRAALAEPEVITESTVERLFLSLCRRHGIPQPSVNHPFGRYKLDFYWPKHALVVETDGPHHRHTIEYDNERDAECIAAGLTVMRFTDQQVKRRGGFIAEQLLRRQAKGASAARRAASGAARS